MVTALRPAKLDQIQGSQGLRERTSCLLLFWSCFPSEVARANQLPPSHPCLAHPLTSCLLSRSTHKSFPPQDLLPACSNLSNLLLMLPWTRPNHLSLGICGFPSSNIQPQRFRLCSGCFRFLGFMSVNLETSPLFAPFQHISFHSCRCSFI